MGEWNAQLANALPDGERSGGMELRHQKLREEGLLRLTKARLHCSLSTGMTGVYFQSLVYPKPCKDTNRRPQLCLAGTAPYLHLVEAPGKIEKHMSSSDGCQKQGK